MISGRQLANRRNAKSNGPKTPEGRAGVRLNAIQQVVVEDLVAARWLMNRVRKMEPGFFALRRGVFSTLDPQAQLALIVLDDAQDADTIGKMSLFEARFERSFHKAHSKSCSVYKPSGRRCVEARPSSGVVN